MNSPVNWGRRTHQLHLSRGVKLPQMSVQDMTINQPTSPYKNKLIINRVFVSIKQKL